MKTALALLLFCCAAAPARAADDAVGPAPVARRLSGEGALAPLPAPTPTTSVMQTPGPAVAVSAAEALPALPTEEELRIQAYKEAEARRPPPLKPKLVPQQVQSMGGGRFLILPEKPLDNAGTLSGQMFRDASELAVPEIPQPATLMPMSPTAPSPTAPSPIMAAVSATTSPSVAIPGPKGPGTQGGAPAVHDVPKPAIPPLVLPYSADQTDPDPAALPRLKAWAARLDKNMVYVMKVTGRTQAPPMGQTAAQLTAARWNAVAALLQEAGVKLAPPSLMSLKPEGAGKGGQSLDGGGQTLVVKVGKQAPVAQ